MLPRSPVYTSRAFVLGGDGVGQSALPQLCQECLDPKRKEDSSLPPKTLNVDDFVMTKVVSDLTHTQTNMIFISADNPAELAVPKLDSCPSRS
jgi:hypothetical protein